MFKSTSEIRQTFLKFFSTKKHKIISSSSLIPNNDTSLLLTNSGMNQFKNIFLGLEKYKYNKIATAQRCMRAGGKHNDLEQVGYTDRHHTFFEMLGNFSFGNYFKEDAIKFAWELLTDKKWFSIPKNNLLITVYEEDNESYNIWFNKIGIKKNNIIKIGDNKGKRYKSDNFWSMGKIGPCGPCSEIFYNKNINLCSDPSKDFFKNKKKYLEIWNLVFMQFNRKNDGTMDLLPIFSVDTGMGLERISSVLQSVESNYDIDIFKKIISNIIDITHIKTFNSISLRIIADHIRACIFLIVDGVYPSNEKQGYVLKRIIRRAIFHGYKLGIKKYFLYKLVYPVIKIMKLSYINILYKKNIIEKIIYKEEKQFHNTLNVGTNILKKKIKNINKKKLDGNIAFWLHDTHGFPLDLTIDICKSYGIYVDIKTFNNNMKKQKKQSKSNNKKLININKNFLLKKDKNTKFLGLNKNKCFAKIIGIYQNDNKLKKICNHNKSMILLDKTVFYGESGGQVGDIGKLIKEDALFNVVDTQKYKNTIIHIGYLKNGYIKIGDKVLSKVNKEYRNSIKANHSATHILHYALIKIFGKNIEQKGSYINNLYFRFDFLYNSSIDYNHIITIENIVNEIIKKNLLIKSKNIAFKQAQNKKILMLPYKNYPENVRIVCISDLTKELCGGIHVNKTKEIGLFLITDIYSISSGIKRIEAITGNKALEKLISQNKKLNLISIFLKLNKKDIFEKIKKLYEDNLKLKKEIKKFKKQQIKYQIKNFTKNFKKVNKFNLLNKYIKNISVKNIYKIIEKIKFNFEPYIINIITIIDDKINIIVNISKNISNYIKATDIIKYFIKINNSGHGGGCDYSARANSNNINDINNTLVKIEKMIYKKILNIN